MRQPDALTDLSRSIVVTTGTAAMMFILLFILIWVVAPPAGYLLGWYVPAIFLSALTGIGIAQRLRATWLAIIPGIVVGFVAFWAVMFVVYIQTAN